MEEESRRGEKGRMERKKKEKAMEDIEKREKRKKKKKQRGGWESERGEEKEERRIWKERTECMVKRESREGEMKKVFFFVTGGHVSIKNIFHVNSELLGSY